jgi:DNA polymerase-3 subunit alpha
MTDYRAAARQIGAVPIHDIMSDFAAEEGPERFSDGQQVTVAGVVISSKTRTTKNNTLMAYVVVEDEMASIELLCFNRTIEQCGSYMVVNTPVVVKGRLSVRDEKPPQIMCDTIYPMTMEVGTVPLQETATTDDGSVIYLRVPSIDSREFRQIKRVMTMFEGETPVKIRVADTGKLVGSKCLNHPAFLDECRLWLGTENVVVKTKR